MHLGFQRFHGHDQYTVILSAGAAHGRFLEAQLPIDAVIQVPALLRIQTDKLCGRICGSSAADHFTDHILPIEFPGKTELHNADAAGEPGTGGVNQDEPDNPLPFQEKKAIQALPFCRQLMQIREAAVYPALDVGDPADFRRRQHLPGHFFHVHTGHLLRFPVYVLFLQTRIGA